METDELIILLALNCQMQNLINGLFIEQAITLEGEVGLANLEVLLRTRELINQRLNLLNPNTREQLLNDNFLWWKEPLDKWLNDSNLG